MLNGADSERVLLLHEVQSDWAQSARREVSCRDTELGDDGCPQFLKEWSALAIKLVLLHAGLQPALANEGGGTFGLKGLFLHQLFIRILGRFMDKFIHPNTPTTAENPFEIPYPLAIRA